MATPDRVRSCRPQRPVARPTAAPIAAVDRKRRLAAVEELERRIGALELPALGYSTVADHAAIHVLDMRTLAVVMICGHNIRVVEQAIRAQNYRIREIGCDRDIITIVI